MILKYVLPQSIDKAVETSADERIYYSVPIDIGENGNWTNDSFFVVTTKKLYIFSGDNKRIININELEKVTAEPGVGGGEAHEPLCLRYQRNKHPHLRQIRRSRKQRI